MLHRPMMENLASGVFAPPTGLMYCICIKRDCWLDISILTTAGASDLADIEGAYFRRPQDHLWVAEARNCVVGTVALSEDDARVAHLRRLRVAPLWQLDSRVAIGLIKTAVNHARFHGCMKLVFHTSLDSQRVVELLQSLGFQFARIRTSRGNT